MLKKRVTNKNAIPLDDDNIIKNDPIVKYTTACLAKENGYPQESYKLRRNYYTYKGELNGDSIDYLKAVVRSKRDGIDIDHSFDNISAPTQSQLQTWLRDNCDIHIQLLIHSWKERTYCYKIHSENVYVPDSSRFLLNDEVIGKYEDVLERALRHGLNLIKRMKLIKKFTTIRLDSERIDKEVKAVMSFGYMHGPHYELTYPEEEFDTEDEAINYAYNFNDYGRWLILPVVRFE